MAPCTCIDGCVGLLVHMNSVQRVAVCCCEGARAGHTAEHEEGDCAEPGCGRLRLSPLGPKHTLAGPASRVFPLACGDEGCSLGLAQKTQPVEKVGRRRWRKREARRRWLVQCSCCQWFSQLTASYRCMDEHAWRRHRPAWWACDSAAELQWPQLRPSPRKQPRPRRPRPSRTFWPRLGAGAAQRHSRH